jgi:hypothetical protein
MLPKIAVTLRIRIYQPYSVRYYLTGLSQTYSVLFITSVRKLFVTPPQEPFCHTAPGKNEKTILITRKKKRRGKREKGKEKREAEKSGRREKGKGRPKNKFSLLSRFLLLFE